MVDCGFDESADKQSAKGNLLVVAAHVGATSHLRKFTRLWQSDLDEVGIPYFHAKDLWNRQAKSFNRISNAKRSRLLGNLVSRVHKYVDWGFCAFIDVDTYHKETTDRFRSQWGSAYSFALQMVLVYLRRELERLNRLKETVNILVEDGHANSGQALNALKEMKLNKHGFMSIGNYGLGGKQGNPILQSADALAYGACQYLSGKDSEIFAALRSGVKRAISPLTAIN